MTKLQKKLAALISSSAMLLNVAVLPVSAATYSFEVSGNGSNSENEISIEKDRNVQVNQNNNSNIVNDINVSANTGNNEVSDNTGGEVEVETGDTTIEAVIVNDTNYNEAVVEQCDCDNEVNVKVSGNGTDSENEVDLEFDNETNVVQNNRSRIRNRLNFDANSGNNDVEDNTGGEVELTTGNVTLGALVENIANRNVASVGGNGGNGGTEVDLEVSGNGSDSENEVDLEFDNEVGIWQDNYTTIGNYFLFAGNSGDNDVEDNTVGSDEDPSLTTGDVTVGAFVGNAAGFNVAAADCGCVLEVTGSISDNGTDSENEVELEFDDELSVTQDNRDRITNRAEVEAETGDNDVEDNTGGEVAVETGASSSIFELFNFGGINLFGDVEFEMPWSGMFD